MTGREVALVIQVEPIAQAIHKAYLPLAPISWEALREQTRQWLCDAAVAAITELHASRQH